MTAIFGLPERATAKSAAMSPRELPIASTVSPIAAWSSEKIPAQSTRIAVELEHASMRAGVTRGSRTPERVQQRDEVIGHEADPKQRVEERHHHVDVDDDWCGATRGVEPCARERGNSLQRSGVGASRA